MEIPVIEALYPQSFRKEEAEELGRYLRNRYSLELVGMKRVGISNFLRFFLNHKSVSTSYFQTKEKHLLIPVDLNDLVEREIFPFWTLTFKRIVDAVEASALAPEVKTRIESLFLGSIQSQDLFLLIDNIRRSLLILVEHNIVPTLFFLRFDRMEDTLTVAFFDNLKGLQDATDGKLAFVFTTFRSLDNLFPSARTSLSVLAHSMYIKPASHRDMEIIYKAYDERYNLKLPQALEKALFDTVGGNVQYLQLALIILNEKKDIKITTQKELLQLLVEDERITLQSEELWESLTNEEKKVLLKINRNETVTDEEKTHASYLWKTGFLTEIEGKTVIFNPLFTYYLQHKKEEPEKTDLIHLTKKEHLLFTLLQAHVGDICERDSIIEAVWPEYKEFGVSDWAIDRLVARVRVKLRKQQSPYEIVTVRTRGYKLSVLQS